MKRKWMLVVMLLIVPAMLLSVSCAKKSTAPAQETEAQAAERAKQQELEQQRLEEERLAAERAAQLEREAAEREMMMAQNRFLNEHVYFDFDSATLDELAQELLKQKAMWLRDNPDANIVIGGHCDERGTNAYNLALGERRAEAVKAFLVDLGIAPSRLTTISYGEEKPLAMGQGEEIWAKNRRADFVLE